MEKEFFRWAERKQEDAYGRIQRTPRNIIFLDIDGVLNTLWTKEKTPLGCIGIDPYKVLLLKQIVEKNNAQVVLTSSWKKHWDRYCRNLDPDTEYMIAKLAKQDVFIADAILSDGASERGAYINKWLHDNPHKEILILDDEKNDLTEQKLSAYWLETSPKYGLKPAHVGAARRIFEKQQKRKSGI